MCGRRWCYAGRKSRWWYDVYTNGVWPAGQEGDRARGSIPQPRWLCLSLGAAVVPTGAAGRLPSRLSQEVPQTGSSLFGLVGRDGRDFFSNGFDFTLSVPRWVSFNFPALSIPSCRLRVSEGWKPGSRGRVYILFMWLNLFWFLSCKMWILLIFIIVIFCY